MTVHRCTGQSLLRYILSTDLIKDHAAESSGSVVGALQGKWSKEEGEQLRQLVADKGPKWAEISRSLGRLPEGCRDKWRELRLGDAKQNGRWSEDETERLRSLVNEYMNKKQVCMSLLLGYVPLMTRQD